MIFATDLDGVICDFNKILRQYIKKVTNYDIGDNPDSFRLSVPGYTDLEMAKMVNIVTAQSINAPPIDKNILYLSYIYKLVKEPILIITARNKAFKNVTEKWLEKNVGDKFKYIIRHFDSSFKKKSHYLDKDTKYFVDDYYMNCNDVAPHVKYAFLINMNYNRNKSLKDNVIIVNSLKDVYEYIKDEDFSSITLEDFINFSYLNIILKKYLNEDVGDGGLMGSGNSSAGVATYETPAKKKKLLKYINKKEEKKLQKDDDVMDEVEADEMSKSMNIAVNTQNRLL